MPIDVSIMNQCLAHKVKQNFYSVSWCSNRAYYPVQNLGIKTDGVVRPRYPKKKEEMNHIQVGMCCMEA